MAYYAKTTPTTKTDLEKLLYSSKSTNSTAAAPKQTTPKIDTPPASTTQTDTPVTPEKPTYADSYHQQLQALYDAVTNRPEFRYNINEDALFAQYRDSYTQAGRTAMEDAMGKAASLTGGYGSTYSQSAGQQAYGNYLQKLHDVVPALEQRAYDRDRQAYDDLLEQYSLTLEQSDREYQQYLDALSQYQKDTATAYDRLQQLITSTGYTPTAQELAAADMTESQAQAFRKYYTAQNTPKYTAGGKGGQDNAQTPYVDLKSLDYDGYNDLQTHLVGIYKADGEKALQNRLKNWTDMGYINQVASDIMYNWVMEGGHLTQAQEAQLREEQRKEALGNLAFHAMDLLNSVLHPKS